MSVIKLFVKSLLIVVCCLMGTLLNHTGNCAVTYDMSVYESMLIDKINMVRQNPLIVSEIIANELMANTLPDWLLEVQGGMVLLKPDARLKQSASQHTDDMLTNNFYGKIASNGKTVGERITETGYYAELYGEHLAMITFINYTSPEAAVENMFARLIKRELETISDDERLIFNPMIEDIGVSFRAGVFIINGRTSNVYMLTCDFGTRLDTDDPYERDGFRYTEYHLIDLVNQARMDPIATAEHLGIPPIWAEEQINIIFSKLKAPLHPVMISPGLQNTAYETGQEYILNINEVNPADNGISQKMRVDKIQCAAYDVVARTGYIRLTDNVSPAAAVDNIFRNLFYDELLHADNDDGFIFNPDMQIIGPKFGIEWLPGNDNNEDTPVFIITTVLGRNSVSRQEREALALINQARTMPIQTALNMGLDASRLPDPNIEPMLSMPPMVFDGKIYSAAHGHAMDMRQFGYYDTFSYDGSEDLGDRLLLQGYTPRDYSEELALYGSIGVFDVGASGNRLIDDMIVQKIRGWFILGNRSHLLSPKMKSAGIRLQYSEPVLEENDAKRNNNYFQSNYTLLLVADVATSDEEQGLHIVGQIWFDRNDNGLFDRGEGLPFQPVAIKGAPIDFTIFSDELGCFSLPLPRGFYELESTYQSSTLVQPVMLGLTHESVFFSFDAIY